MLTLKSKTNTDIVAPREDTCHYKKRKAFLFTILFCYVFVNVNTKLGLSE